MGLEQVSLVLDKSFLVLWLAGFICNSSVGALGTQHGLSGPKSAAYGNITVGSLWGLTFFGFVLVTLYHHHQDSYRRLESRGHKSFNIFFSKFLSMRLVCSLIWVVVLPFIEHTKDQQIFSVACLLDILLLLGRNLLLTVIDSDCKSYKEFEWTTEVLAKKPRFVAQATGCISAAKATLVVEARERQYGSNLSSATPPADKKSQRVHDLIAQSQMVLYAPRETFTSDHTKARTGPELSSDELEHLPIFLRCTCCLDCPVPPPPDQREYDIESASQNAENRRRLERRLSFLQNGPVAAVFNFVPKEGIAEGVHKLCDICERVCAEIIGHLSTVERRSKIERLLHPRRDVCSLQHCNSPSSLQDSSQTCHLCSLIWASLDLAQQNTLLRGDKKLMAKSRKTSSPNTGILDQTQRSIRLVVFEDLIVPHFSGFKRPRRWVRSASGSGAMRIEIGSEFANPLYLPGPKVSWESLFQSLRSREGPKETSGPIVFPMSDHTGSGSVIDMISHALKDRICHTSRLPTRVLDVRGFTTGRARLQHSAHLNPKGSKKYIALSHCWGKIDMPRLLKRNIDDYMKGFDISGLPRTFREAIEVTFRLGAPFIWIDSLCIVQDDPVDWEYEASLMASIYTNAFCTVAAVASVDGNGGLFRSQKPKESSPCLIGLKKDGDPIYAVPYPQSDDGVLRANIALSTWNSRGWCLQERYLSSAVVYFCESQVYIGLGDQLGISHEDETFSGTSHSAVSLAKPPVSRPASDGGRLVPESLPMSGIPEPSTSTRLRRVRGPPNKGKENYSLKGQLEMGEIWDHRFFPKNQTERLNHIRTSMVTQRLGTNTIIDESSIWWAVVNEYSMRDLTNPFDKLPAIRGLAVHLHDSYLDGTDIQYIMGLWTNNMAAGLLWYVDLGAARPRPESYRAPSWSWASVEGVVSNDSLRLRKENADIEIIQIDIQDHHGSPATSQPWLRDRCAPGASITLRGSLKAARWSKAASDSEKRYYVARSLLRHPTEDLETPSALQDLFSPVSTAPPVGPLCHALFDPSSNTRIGWFLPDSPEDLPLDIFCLKIQVMPTEPEDPQATWAVRGLVLVRDTTSVLDEPIASSSRTPVHPSQDAVRYRRIGYFELDLEFRGTHVGSKYIHTDEAAVPGGPATKVATYVEFPIMNEPELDPHGFFADARPQKVVLV